MSTDKIRGLEMTGMWFDEIAGGLLGQSEEAIAIGKLALARMENYQEAEKLRQSRCRLTSVLSNLSAQKQFLINRPEWGTW